MPRATSLCAFLLLAVVSMADAETATLRLEVSATVPPSPCQYPDTCEPLSGQTVTRVSITDGRIDYLGSKPAVHQTGGMLTVLF